MKTTAAPGAAGLGDQGVADLFRRRRPYVSDRMIADRMSADRMIAYRVKFRIVTRPADSLPF